MHTLRRLANAPALGLMLPFLLTLGCGNPSGQGQKTTNSDPQREIDHSLRSEEYVRLGLPAPDKVWSGAEMIQASKVLASFTQERAGLLPRYKSPRSGDVFARLTSIETAGVI